MFLFSEPGEGEIECSSLLQCCDGSFRRITQRLDLSPWNLETQTLVSVMPEGELTSRALGGQGTKEGGRRDGLQLQCALRMWTW